MRHHPSRQVAAVLAFAVSALVALTATARAQYSLIHEDDFESYTPGSYPGAPWANFFPGVSATVTTAQAFEGVQSLRLEGLGTEIRVDYLPLLPIPDQVYLRAALRLGTDGHGAGMGSGFVSPSPPGQGLPANMVCFNEDHSITFVSQTGGEFELGVWEPERWYDVILQIDYAGQRADVVIDGSIRGHLMPCDPRVLPPELFGVEIPLDRILFVTFDFTGGGSNVLFVDDVLLMGITLDAPGGQRPSAPALSAPRPNPARGSATLDLTLPAEATVDVGVFDLAGRRVATLASGALAAGTHALRWEADPGLAAGVYLVGARAGDRHTTRRVVLTR